MAGAGSIDALPLRHRHGLERILAQASVYQNSGSPDVYGLETVLLKPTETRLL